MPSSLEYRLLTEQLEDAQERASNQKPKRTWFGRYPLMRIDHVFISQGIEVVAFEVPRTELTKLASDHMPLVVDLVL